MRLYNVPVSFSLAIALLVLLAQNASAIVFDDGRVHVVDAANSFPFEGVQVDDGPPPRPTTTLEVVSGGEIGTVSEDDVAAFGSSEVTISGGTLGRDLWLYGTADLQMSGGTITQTIGVQDNATATFSGGSTLNLVSTSPSRVTISGGVIGELNTNGQSFVEVLGGEFTRSFRVNSESAVVVYDADVSCTEDPECNLRVSDRAFLVFGGGHVEGDLVAANFGSANLVGGHVEGDLVTTNFGYASLWGGTIAGSLFALDSSLIWIHGSDFNYPTDEIFETSGTLTGTLHDGTPINIPFRRDPSADIWLPEPSALMALGSGIAMLALLYRRLGVDAAGQSSL